MRFIIIAVIFSAALFTLGGGVLVASVDIKVERDNDLHLIRVGEERYEIPDAVITGG